MTTMIVVPQPSSSKPSNPAPPRQFPQLSPRLIAPPLGLGALHATGLAAAGELQALQQGTALPARPGGGCCKTRLEGGGVH